MDFFLLVPRGKAMSSICLPFHMAPLTNECLPFHVGPLTNEGGPRAELRLPRTLITWALLTKS